MVLPKLPHESPQLASGKTSSLGRNVRKIRNDMDRESGDYNEFWDERNYLNAAKDIKCSILIVHGIEDWNVKRIIASIFGRQQRVTTS